MQLRLFYELVIDDRQAECAMADDSARCEQLRKIVADALPAADPPPAAATPASVSAGSRSAFVVGNNNTVVINLLLPKGGEGDDR